MKGSGFSFTAPADWTVARHDNAVTAKAGKVNLLQVLRFELRKPYRVARFAAVAKELDGVAAGLAKQSSGHVATSSTIQVSGRKTRWYELEFGPGKTEEIAFVLVDRVEYQVLCRRLTSASDATCKQLFSSFALQGQ